MLIWNRGRTLILEMNARLFADQSQAFEILHERLVARVPGTAVFMAANQTSLPPILIYHVTLTRALQETVLLVNIKFADDPVIPEEERVQVSRVTVANGASFCPTGFWSVNLHFGFMEAPTVVPSLEKAARDHRIPWQMDEVVYFLGRDNFVASNKGRMGA